MLYSIRYVDESLELVSAESIAEARKEAKCLYDCPIRNITVQEGSGDASEDESDVEDEDEDEKSDDEEEEEEDEDADAD